MERAELEREESELVWSGSFGAQEALKLGNTLAELAAGYERGVTCAITREADGLMLFCWAMDDKAPRNMGFIEWKCDLVRKTGHASLWSDPDDAGYAGAVPIKDPGGRVMAILGVSGLHHGQDHELAVQAILKAKESLQH